MKAEIHTADMRKVTMNHVFQKLLLQLGMVRKSRVMMGRDKTQRIRFRSLSGTANTLFCSAGDTRDGEMRTFAQTDGKAAPRRFLPHLRESR